MVGKLKKVADELADCQSCNPMKHFKTLGHFAVAEEPLAPHLVSLVIFIASLFSQTVVA